MKFDLTIKDAELEELTELVNFMNGSNKVEVKKEASSEPVAAEPVAAEPDLPPPPPEAEDVADDSEFDAEGMPWDERIHASTKTKRKDGTWTRRRNVDDAEYDRIVSELKGAAEPVAQPDLPPPPPAAPVAAEPVAQPDLPPPPPAAPVAAEPVAQPDLPPPPPAAPVATATINDVLVKLQQSISQGKFQPTDLPVLMTEMNEKFGTQCVAITDIAGSEDMLKFALEYIESKGA